MTVFGFERGGLAQAARFERAVEELASLARARGAGADVRVRQQVAQALVALLHLTHEDLDRRARDLLRHRTGLLGEAVGWHGGVGEAEPHGLDAVDRLADESKGLVLVTGPAGSGRTTNNHHPVAGAKYMPDGRLLSVVEPVAGARPLRVAQRPAPPPP